MSNAWSKRAQVTFTSRIVLFTLFWADRGPKQIESNVRYVRVLGRIRGRWKIKREGKRMKDMEGKKEEEEMTSDSLSINL